MEFLTKDSHLDYSSDGKSYKELYGMNTFPDMGGAPAKVEVTNMRDGAKRYINGLQETDSLEFEFFYNAETVADSGDVIKKAFSDLKTREKENKLLHWRLVYPDGSSYSWQGKPSVFMKGGNVGDALKYSLTVSLESALDFAEGTAEGTDEETGA